MEVPGKDKMAGDGFLQHNCDLCPFSTKFAQSLKRHAITHLDTKLFKCPKCPFTTKWVDNVKLHLKNVHQPKFRPFPCPHPGCGYAAKLQTLLKNHAETHSDKKSLSCSHPGCNFSTTQRGNLVVHARVHTGEKPWVCQFESCSYAAAQRSNLVSHTRTHTKERPFKCPEPNCEYAAAKQGHLRSHQLTHGPKVGEERQSFPCPLCGYKGKNKAYLSAHVKRHSLEKTLACSVQSCEFRCKLKSNLLHHLESHSEERRYKCELCPFRGKTRSTVTNHLKQVHSQLRPFRCTQPKCDYSTKTKGNLKGHLFTHNPEKKYSCSFPSCDYKAVLNSKVKSHEYNMHSAERKEKCSLCQYTCKTKTHLTSHMRTHTKEAPYKCNEQNCHYRAKQSTQLRQHEKTHHRQKIKK